MNNDENLLDGMIHPEYIKSAINVLERLLLGIRPSAENLKSVHGALNICKNTSYREKECPLCLKIPRADLMKFTDLRYKGYTINIQMPFSWCNECIDSIFCDIIKDIQCKLDNGKSEVVEKI
jgi:hypothetical protein